MDKNIRNNRQNNKGSLPVGNNNNVVQRSD